MSRRSLDDTLQFIRKLDRARTPSEICLQLLRVMKQFGAEHVLAGTIPTLGTSPRRQRENILLDEWPSEWEQRYFSRGYLFQDPTIQQIGQGVECFMWHELDHILKESISARRIMNEAGDFHLRRGFTISLHTIENEVIGLSVAGEHLEISRDMRSMIMLIGSYAIARAISLRDSHLSQGVQLTPREHETLQWAAEGKTWSEIGQLMGITEHGVDKHLRNAKTKLNANSTSYAIAEALRLNLIS